MEWMDPSSFSPYMSSTPLVRTRRVVKARTVESHISLRAILALVVMPWYHRAGTHAAQADSRDEVEWPAGAIQPEASRAATEAPSTSIEVAAIHMCESTRRRQIALTPSWWQRGKFFQEGDTGDEVVAGGWSVESRSGIPRNEREEEPTTLSCG